MKYKMKDVLVDFKGNRGVSIVLVFSMLLFIYIWIFKTAFNNFMSVATFLAWHNIFEFASILAAISIFIVTYYTYEETRSLRMIILGCAFLIMGTLDIFHTLSYKGMEYFLIPNISANRATTFWVLSRMIGSIGVLAAVSLPFNIKSKRKKWMFVVPSLGIIFVLLILVTYFPKSFPTMFIDGYGLTNTKIILEYFIIVVMVLTLGKVYKEYRETKSIQDYLFMAGFLMSIFSEIAFASYGSVYDAYNYLGHIYKLLAHFIMFRGIYTENVQMPYREMQKARNELKDYSENLSSLVKQRTKELEDKNGKLLMDLEYAKEIQSALLPTEMPEDNSVSFEAAYLPAERLSGDFYNVIKLDENNFAIYIGDVAGHGVPAAMLTVFANQNIKALRETEKSSEIYQPSSVLNNIYKSFNQTNFNEETYLVMLYGIYNKRDDVFKYASGGINVAPLIIKNTGKVIAMDVRGFAICMMGNFYKPFFEEREIKLEHGDKILFYTDGLVEAENERGDKYTEKHLIDFIESNYFLNKKELGDALLKELFRHMSDSHELKDDVTFLVMEVH